jgi:hypothetical protein
MRPAVLSNLVCGRSVEALSASQLLDQLPTKLLPLGLLLAPDFDLAQAIASATDHQVVEPHTLPSATKGIERFTHRRGLSDRMARMTSGHRESVAPGAALPKTQMATAQRIVGPPRLFG